MRVIWYNCGLFEGLELKVNGRQAYFARWSTLFSLQVSTSCVRVIQI